MPAPATQREYKEKSIIHGEDWVVREDRTLIVWNDDGVDMRTEVADSELVDVLSSIVQNK